MFSGIYGINGIYFEALHNLCIGRSANIVIILIYVLVSRTTEQKEPADLGHFQKFPQFSGNTIELRELMFQSHCIPSRQTVTLLKHIIQRSLL